MPLRLLLPLLLVLGFALPLAARSDEGGTPAPPDAGSSCQRVEGDDWPEHGDGCRLVWEEVTAEGDWVQNVARVRCDRSVDICGEEVWCRCPSPVRPSR